MSQENEIKTETTENNDADINRRSYLKMVGAGAGPSAGGTGFTSLEVQSVRAQQESLCNTVDNFEDSDLEEYSFDSGSSGARIIKYPMLNGSNALAISDTNTEMISTSGLAN